VVDIDLEEGLADYSEDPCTKAIDRNPIAIDTGLIYHMVVVAFNTILVLAHNIMVVLAVSTKDITDRNPMAIDTFLIPHILSISHKDFTIVVIDHFD
jgi:hypothetical protein